MRIYVTAPHSFAGDDLVPGEEYEVRPAETGTERQNRAFHALVQEYWASGCHSYNALSLPHFRELIKLYLGAGTEKYYDPLDAGGNRLAELAVRHRVKSWAKYTKPERTGTIDRLISEMLQAGVQTAKFHEILRGMEGGAYAGAGSFAEEAMR